MAKVQEATFHTKEESTNGKKGELVGSTQGTGLERIHIRTEGRSKKKLISICSFKRKRRKAYITHKKGGDITKKS